MNKVRKTINILGIFSLCGAMLIILGIGLYNLNRHRVTNTDKRNIERKKQIIIENEKTAMTTLAAIMKMTSFDDAKDEIAKYFSPGSKIPNTTVYKKEGYLFNVSLYGYFWFCYAWPEEYGTTGAKSFYIGSSEAPKITERKFSGITNPAKNKDADYWKDFSAEWGQT